MITAIPSRVLSLTILTTASWLLTAHTAFCAGSASVPVSVLLNKSDAVVIANVVSIAPAVQNTTLTLDVQRVLKGPVQPGEVIVADYRISPQSSQYGMKAEKDRGLFFLVQKAGKWIPVPVLSGSLSDIRDAFFALPINSAPKRFQSEVQPSVHEKVLAELAGALDGGASQPFRWNIDFAWEFRSNRSAAMRYLYTQFQSSANNQLKMLGLRAAIADGDYRVFEQVQRDASKIEPHNIGQLAEEIRYYFTASHPKSVLSLGNLAVSQSSPAQIQKACLVALARVHTRESLQYLAGFLDSADVESQALAVGGLAMFANNVPAGKHEPAPGPWKYRTEETIRYSAMDPAFIKNNPAALAFWKSWWTEHRVELQ